MTVNRPLPKDLGRLSFDKNIPVSLGPVVFNGTADTQPDSEAYFLFFADRDIVLDEALLFVGERYENATTNEPVQASLRWRPATFDAAITDADKASTWTNTLVTRQIAANYAGLEKRVHQILGPTDESVFIPAGSHVALVMTDDGGTFPLRRLTGVSVQLRGYYPKSGNA